MTDVVETACFENSKIYLHQLQEFYQQILAFYNRREGNKALLTKADLR